MNYGTDATTYFMSVGAGIIILIIPIIIYEGIMLLTEQLV
jgi:hypothetical protein